MQDVRWRYFVPNKLERVKICKTSYIFNGLLKLDRSSEVLCRPLCTIGHSSPYRPADQRAILQI